MTQFVAGCGRDRADPSLLQLDDRGEIYFPVTWEDIWCERRVAVGRYRQSGKLAGVPPKELVPLAVSPVLTVPGVVSPANSDTDSYLPAHGVGSV